MTLTTELRALVFAPTHDQVPVGQLVATEFDILVAYAPNSALNTTTSVNATDVPRYCRGILIRTDRGEVAVEHLAIGDLLPTMAGALHDHHARRAHGGGGVSTSTSNWHTTTRSGPRGHGARPSSTTTAAPCSRTTPNTATRTPARRWRQWHIARHA